MRVISNIQLNNDQYFMILGKGPSKGANVDFQSEI